MRSVVLHITSIVPSLQAAIDVWWTKCGPVFWSPIRSWQFYSHAPCISDRFYPHTMQRAKQAWLSEANKGSASTKSPSDEELSPKRAVKALKDSERYQQNKLNPKTGILDKCVLCKKSGVRTMLEGAGSATNMRCFIIYPLVKIENILC